jgi:uncharacterized damage-inducible protein DinB
MTVDLNRVPPFYHNYIRQVKAADLKQAFEQYLPQVLHFLGAIDEAKWDYRYAEDKWSIREMVQHIIDAERIFSYRALCMARQDRTSLPGFDENEYVIHSKAGKRSREDLLAELESVQSSTTKLFASFDEEQLESEGIANGNSIYVRAIGFITIGHALHHVEVLRERYLG